MSKYIYIVKNWLRPVSGTVPRDCGVPAADMSLPQVLQTYNQHRDRSTAQMLAGTGIMH